MGEPSPYHPSGDIPTDTLSFAGLFNIIFLIPVFPLLHYLNWETFELPPTRTAWTIVIVNMLITLSSDYLYVLGEWAAQ